MTGGALANQPRLCPGREEYEILVSRPAASDRRRDVAQPTFLVLWGDCGLPVYSKWSTVPSCDMPLRKPSVRGSRRRGVPTRRSNVLSLHPRFAPEQATTQDSVLGLALIREPTAVCYNLLCSTLHAPVSTPFITPICTSQTPSEYYHTKH
jgi:hypothetical protein